MPLVSLYEIIHLGINTQSSVKIIRAAASSFESGFTGCTGLTITSLDDMGRLILIGVIISRLFADALRMAKRSVKSNPLQITTIPKTKTFSIILKIL